MDNIGSVLGFENTFISVVDAIEQKKNKISIINSQKDSGQVFFSEYLRDRLKEHGYSVLLIKACSHRSDDLYSSIDQIESDVIDNNNEKLNLKKSFLNDSIDFIFDSNVPFKRTIVDFISLASNRALSRKNNFSKEDIQRITNIHDKIKSKKTIVVLLDFSRFDEKSLELIAKIVADDFTESFKKFNDVKFIAIESNENKYSVSNLIPHTVKKSYHYLIPPGEAQIKKAFPYLGFNSNVPENIINTIIRVTNCDVDVIKEIGKANLDIDDLHPSIKNDDFFNKLSELLTIKINDNYQDSEIITKYLSFLSTAKVPLDILTITCALENIKSHDDLILKSENYKRAYKDCNNLNLIREEKGLHLIDNNVLKDVFLRINFYDQKETHSKIANCLEKISPNSYFDRIIHLYSSGRLEEAFHLSLVRYLKLRRMGFEKISIDYRYNKLFKKDSTYYRFEQIDESTRLEKDREFIKAINNLEFDTFDCAKEMILERDLLISRLLAHTRIKKNYSRAICKLEYWIENEILNFDFESRVYESIIVISILDQNIDLANKLYRDLIFKVEQRKTYDKDAIYIIHRLAWKATALFDGEIAADKLTRAVEFFTNARRNKPESRSANPIDLFISTNNLAATLITLGKYKKAKFYLELATEYFKEIQHIKNPPRKQIILNNNLLCAVRLNELSAQDAAKILQERLVLIKSSSDSHLLMAALSCYLCLSGNFQEALNILKKSWDDIINSTEFSAYSVMVVGQNLYSTLHMVGYTDEAKKIYHFVGKHLDKVKFSGADTRKKCHELMWNAFEKVAPGDAQGWDSFLYNNYENRIGGEWDYYCKGFFISDLQYWVDD